jgi:hypothetical protein
MIRVRRFQPLMKLKKMDVGRVRKRGRRARGGDEGGVTDLTTPIKGQDSGR